MLNPIIWKMCLDVQYTVGPAVLILSKMKVFIINWKSTHRKRNICMTVYFLQNLNMSFRYWDICIWKWLKSVFHYFALSTVSKWSFRYKAHILPCLVMISICIPQNMNQISLIYIYKYSGNVSNLPIVLLWEAYTNERRFLPKFMSILIG